MSSLLTYVGTMRLYSAPLQYCARNKIFRLPSCNAGQGSAIAREVGSKFRVEGSLDMSLTSC